MSPEELVKRWLEGKIHGYSDSTYFRALLKRARDKRVSEEKLLFEMDRRLSDREVDPLEVLNLEKGIWKLEEEAKSSVRIYIVMSVLSPVDRRTSAKFYEIILEESEYLYYEKARMSPKEYINRLRNTLERSKLEIDISILESNVFNMIKEISQLMERPLDLTRFKLKFFVSENLYKLSSEELEEYRRVLRTVSRLGRTASKYLRIMKNKGHHPSKIGELRPLTSILLNNNKVNLLSDEVYEKFQEMGLISGKRLTDLGEELSRVVLFLDSIARISGKKKWEELFHSPSGGEERINPSLD